MFIAILLAGTVQPAEPRVQVRATVRILNSVTVTEDKWRLTKGRKERLIRDELGRKVRLRTIEFE